MTETGQEPERALFEVRLSQALVDDEEWHALRPALARSYYGHAEKVVELERALGRYLGCADRPVVCVASGTAALHCALLALDIGPGDEVLVPTWTFVAAYQMITACGATPVSCDVDEQTCLLDLKDAEARVTPRTRAIMPVFYVGNPGDLDAVYSFAAANRLRVIEDAAHAFGSQHRGRRIGSFGDLCCFSFDSIKNITCGEGGAVVCPDERIADRVRRLRLLGMTRNHPETGGIDREKTFSVMEQGYRYHMSNLNAALGLVQLSKVERFVERRRDIARTYDAAFQSLGWLRPLAVDYENVAPHIYAVRVIDGRRNQLMRYLKERGIETGINYIPNHLHPRFAQRETQLPIAERVHRQLLNLPLHCALSDEDVERIVRDVIAFA